MFEKMVCVWLYDFSLLTSQCTFILQALRECVLGDEVDSRLPTTPYMVTNRATLLQRGRSRCQSHRPVKTSGSGRRERVAMVTVKQGQVGVLVLSLDD